MSSEEVASYTHLDGLGMRNKATEEVTSLLEEAIRLKDLPYLASDHHQKTTLYMIKESEPHIPSPRPGGAPASQQEWW